MAWLGRLKPGETVDQSASRILKREIGVEIKDSRFETVGHYSFVWEKREQPPKDHGTADISVVLTTVLTADEIGRIKIDPNEYSDKMWVSPKDVVQNPSFHPALRRAARDLIAIHVWKRIEDLSNQQNYEKEICKLVKQLIAIKSDHPLNFSELGL